jgi:beta-phosphoglucomutase-like phosphatase (HAD superfamily)
MKPVPHAAINAVVFDLDGVLLQSEEVWDAVRERYVRERGGRYGPAVQRAMMGMNSIEWSRYLHSAAGVPDEPAVINDEVVRRILESYRTSLPVPRGNRRRMSIRKRRAVSPSIPCAVPPSRTRTAASAPRRRPVCS